MVIDDPARGWFEIASIRTYPPATLSHFPNGAISVSNGISPHNLTYDAEEGVNVLLPRPTTPRRPE
jgi:hypothetical protein